MPASKDVSIFYRPFLQTSIGFFNQSLFDSSSQSFSSVNILSDINLYYQPLQQPIVGIIYLILRIIIIIAGEFLQIQVLKLLKRESSLVEEILKVFLYVQMVYWPLFVLFHTSTDFIHPLQEVFGSWYCIVGTFIIGYGMTLIIFHSFVVGLMRYTFIVHDEWVANFGKERAKRIFLWICILVPLIAVLWRRFGGQYVSAISSFNKCNGRHHLAFMIEDTVDSSTAKKNFCFFENYDGEDQNRFLAILKRTLCTLSSVLYLIMGFNFVEGIFYWKTIKHVNK